ncbi:MAG: hypothetical protein Q8Q39_02040 [bacterium]|nr:hypothetical protein [bacterium]
MSDDDKKKFTVIALVAAALLIYVAYWYRTLKPASELTEGIRENSTHRKEELLRQAADDAEGVGDDSAGDVRVSQVAASAVTIQEFTAPYFVKAEPAHEAVVALSDLSRVQLTFSRQLAGKNNIIVLAGNKLVASGGSIAPADPKTLVLSVSAGAFETRDFATGVYEVYYDVCFTGDTCYKGQYAFVGIQ